MTTVENFAKEARLDDAMELERVVLLGFYYLKTANKEQFTAAEAAEWLTRLSYPRPNVARLGSNLSASKDVVRGTHPGSHKLHRAALHQLEGTFPKLMESEEIEHTGSILPKALYSDTRGYLESLADQINSSYEHNIFDGCAVLMRRLMEILLILSFENHSVAAEIKHTDGTYLMLEIIIGKAKNNQQLKLSRNSREALETFRNLGNFSAHKIHYNCKREDIKKVALDYRALIEELLYKAGIKK